MDYKPLFVNFAKMILAGCLTFLACFALADLFNTVELPKYVFEGVKILAVATLCIIVYTMLNLILKMDYAKDLISRLTKK